MNELLAGILIGTLGPGAAIGLFVFFNHDLFQTWLADIY